ncbi:MAG TPA: adenylyl-sulfate kinase [Azospirillaceae bacterium]|nr:adenylyl-sulfate kinase [Azospirillaceae bacterium]
MNAISPIITAERQLPIVIVGHVDHGKSTLVGRLLHDTGSLPEGKVEAVREMSRRRGMPFEWSFVMDALQAERDQGITIDTTQVRFKTATRGYVIIDAPGHKEFLKNMVTGAASAEGALLVIDALEGVLEQSRRHAYLLHLLGVRQVAVAVNKMDAVEFGETRFREVETQIRNYLAEIGVTPQAVIPISARHGNNIAERCRQMAWYDGPTITEALDAFTPAPALVDQPLRLPVQDVYKFDDRRLIAGRIESGRLKVGDTLYFAPTGKTAKVASIETWNVDAERVAASAGQSVAITLDHPIFVERGHVASLAETRPVETRSLKARLFWLGHNPIRVGSRYTLKLATAEHQVTVEAIERVIDVEDLSGAQRDEVRRNEVAEVVLASRTPLAVDGFDMLPRTGRGVLVDGYDIVGGCIIEAPDAAQAEAQRNLYAVAHEVTPDARAALNGHKGGILWLTGLSGAGKSTVAMALEKELFRRGCQVFVLDGDGVRQGLNEDLGFSGKDRSENLRRVAHVARLFAEAGMIVVTAFISPTRDDRTRARDIGGEYFHEIYVKADLAICESRDPKGLYKKARAGALPEFTGISAPYEEPDAPEVVLDTGANPPDAVLTNLLAYVDEAFLPKGRRRATG